MKKGQASSEYIILAAAILLIVLAGIYLLENFSSGSPEIRISESKNYWKSASPFMVVDWSVKSAAADANGNASAQLAIVVRNPTQQTLTLNKILISGTNFSRVYSYGANYAGRPDNLSITMAPSEQNVIVLIQDSGPAIAKNYQLPLVFEYDPNSSQGGGAAPLRGTVQFVSAYAAAAPPSTGCPVGQLACNITGASTCCLSSQICSLGIQCCLAGQVSCGGSCCTGSCQGSTCVAAGYYVCGMGQCAIGLPCCNGVCGAACADYVVSNSSANQTVLQSGQTATVGFTTANIGAGDATAVSYTAVYRTVGGVSALFANYTIPALNNGTNVTNGSVVFTCNASAGYGTHTFAAYSDSTSAIFEADEGNNVHNALFSITCNNVASSPDLVVAKLDANQTVLLLSQKALITINTSNIGNAASVASITSVATGGSGNPLSAGSVGVGALAPGASENGTVNFTCSMAALGSHTITATADATGTNSESDEGNNVNSSLVINCTAPDLIVSSLAANATGIYIGQTANITITTKNNGTGNASPSITAVISNASASAVSPGSFAITTLTPGLAQVSYSTFTCSAASLGSHRIYASADNTSIITESDEADNVNSSLTLTCNVNFACPALGSGIRASQFLGFTLGNWTDLGSGRTLIYSPDYAAGEMVWPQNNIAIGTNFTIEADVYITRGFYQPGITGTGPNAHIGITALTPTATNNAVGYFLFINRFNNTPASNPPFSQYLCIGELDYNGDNSKSYRSGAGTLNFDPRTATLKPIAPYQKCVQLSSPIQPFTWYHLRMEMRPGKNVTGYISGPISASVSNIMNDDYLAARAGTSGPYMGAGVIEGAGVVANMCYFNGTQGSCACGAGMPAMKPDLTISNITTRLRSGRSYWVNVTTKNIGNLPTWAVKPDATWSMGKGDSNERYQSSHLTNPFFGKPTNPFYAPTAGLDVGQEYKYEVRYDCGGQGFGTMNVSSDYYGEINESNENNNWGKLEFNSDCQPV